MPKYKLARDFAAVMQTGRGNVNVGGKKGDTVEVDEATAEWMNRDCPGVMVRAKGVSKKAAAKE